MHYDQAVNVLRPFVQSHVDMTWWIGKVTPHSPTEANAKICEVPGCA
jgi:hypothetical protein